MTGSAGVGEMDTLVPVPNVASESMGVVCMIKASGCEDMTPGTLQTHPASKISLARMIASFSFMRSSSSAARHHIEEKWHCLVALISCHEVTGELHIPI